MGKTFDIFVIVVSFAAAGMLLTGHSDFIMNGGDRNKRKSIYDEKKMSKVFGIAFLLSGILTVLDSYVFKAAWSSIVYTVLLIIIFAAAMIYVRKKCRK